MVKVENEIYFVKGWFRSGRHFMKTSEYESRLGATHCKTNRGRVREREEEDDFCFFVFANEAARCSLAIDPEPAL